MRLLALFFLLIAGAQASQVIIDRTYSPGTSFRVIASIDAMPRNGFFPVRVEMANNKGDAISWTIETEVQQYPEYHYSARSDSPKIDSQFRVECPAGSKKVTELLVPIHRGNVHRYNDSMSQSIIWEARSSALSDSVERGMYQSSDRAGVHKIALSQNLASEFRSALRSAWEKVERSRYRSSGRGKEPYQAIFDSASLFENWRAYAGMDALIFDREDYLKTTPGVQSALDQWVQSGGHLMILSRGASVSIPGFSEEVSREGFGSRRIIGCGDEYDEADARALIQNLDTESPLRAVSSRNREVGQAHGSLTKELGERSLQTNLILIALIIFGIVVGPVNLFKWADKTRRHRLFFTTPLISLLTSVLLIGFMVLRDGFGGDGVRAVAIDVGGPGDNSAAIVQEQFSRTGILFSSSFDLDKHSIISALPAPVTDYNMADSKSANGIVSYSAKVTDDGWEFSGDWFESRTEQAQALRSVIPSREKLELIASVDGAPRLASSFSYSLENVYYRESSAKVWKAESIEPGETVTMVLSGASAQEEAASDLIKRFSSNHRRRLDSVVKRAGSFSAQAVGAPAIDNYDSVDWKESPAFITGLLK